MRIHLIGVPLDLGGARRGCDMGPSALKLAGIGDRLESLGHTLLETDIPVTTRGQLDVGPPNARYLSEIQRINEATAAHVALACKQGDFPLILGGDHSVAIGSIAGVSSACRQTGKKVGVIWVDAHADMNVPETTPSGNIHGMPLAVNLGMGAPELCRIGGDFAKVEAANVALIGIRSLDRQEAQIVKESGVHAYTMADIDRQGIAPIMDRVLNTLRQQVDVVHLSFDLDSLDPSHAPGVGTPVEGGLSYREAHLIMEMMAESGLLGSLDVVELNPVLDQKNQTGLLAAELVASAFGKRIL